MSNMPKAFIEKRDELANEYKVFQGKAVTFCDGYNSCYAELAPLIEEMKEALVHSLKLIEAHTEDITEEFGNECIEGKCDSYGHSSVCANTFFADHDEIHDMKKAIVSYDKLFKEDK